MNTQSPLTEAVLTSTTSNDVDAMVYFDQAFDRLHERGIATRISINQGKDSRSLLVGPENQVVARRLLTMMRKTRTKAFEANQVAA